MAKHLATMHPTEVETLRLLSLKKEEARKAKAVALRHMGNHKHNMLTLKQGAGEIVPARAPSHPNENYKDYAPCTICLAWFKKTDYYRHACTGKTADFQKPNLQMGLAMAESASGTNTEGVTRVLLGLQHDTIGTIARTDSILLDFLRLKVSNEQWKQKKWRDQIRMKLRYGAKFLIEMRETFPNATLHEVLLCKNFEVIVNAVKTCAITASGYESGAIPLKVGHVVKDCIRRVKAIALKKNDITRIEDVRRLSELVEMEWTVRINENARFLIKERKRNKRVILPTTTDVVKFSAGMRKELSEAIINFERNQTQSTYRTLQEATLVETIRLNRKRGTETASLEVLDYKNAREAEESAEAEEDEDIFNGLTEAQKQEARKHHLVVVNGKCNKNNFILLTTMMKKAYDLILEFRHIGEINPNNKFFFALPWLDDSYMNHSRLLKKYTEEFNVKNMSTTQMRKYMATTLQVFNEEWKLYLSVSSQGVIVCLDGV